MRGLILLIAIALNATAMAGDKRQRVYLDMYMAPTSKGKAAYYMEPGGMQGELHLCTVYTLAGRLKAEGGCADPGLQVRHGHWRFFHENGKLESEGDYVMGNKSGVWQRFDPWGQELAEKVYDAAPLENIVFTMVPDMPVYPGGEDALITYLRTSVPELKGATATFVVEKDGELTAIRVQNAAPDAAERLALALDKAPPFEPGTRNGLPVRVEMRVPLK